MGEGEREREGEWNGKGGGGGIGREFEALDRMAKDRNRAVISTAVVIAFRESSLDGTEPSRVLNARQAMM